MAQYLDIHRGDRFDYIVSMSTPEFGLTAWRARARAAPTARSGRSTYRCGDLNTSLIKTVQGRTILLQHDVVSPRPYDRLNSIAGHEGHLQGLSRTRLPRGACRGASGGTPSTSSRPQYEHPLWTNVGELARKHGGHGGMDFIMCYRLVQCLREGLVPDFDVYDAAAWSAPGPAERGLRGAGQRADARSPTSRAGRGPAPPAPADPCN